MQPNFQTSRRWHRGCWFCLAQNVCVNRLLLCSTPNKASHRSQLSAEHLRSVLRIATTLVSDVSFVDKISIWYFYQTGISLKLHCFQFWLSCKISTNSCVYICANITYKIYISLCFPSSIFCEEHILIVQQGPIK